MGSFRKISDRREPPGMERLVLKKLPLYWAGGTCVPLLVAMLARMLPPDGSVVEAAKRLHIIDYVAAGAIMTVWTAVLTVAIGCLVVVVMKGPHYAADSYYLDGPRANNNDTPDNEST
ncbi:MAG: hypothetical protein P8Y61_00200 [Gammaproteobacteria bacterium]|jgi:uncharacterized membrane protein